MRPPKSTVEAAIREAGGNLAKAAKALGCARQSLYLWIYQFGLERLAGITLSDDRRHDIKTRRVEQPEKSTVQSADQEGTTFQFVSTPAQVREYKIPATAKVNELLWKRVKKEAIDRGCTTSELVEEALHLLFAGKSTK